MSTGTLHRLRSAATLLALLVPMACTSCTSSGGDGGGPEGVANAGAGGTAGISGGSGGGGVAGGSGGASSSSEGGSAGGIAGAGGFGGTAGIGASGGSGGMAGGSGSGGSGGAAGDPGSSGSGGMGIGGTSGDPGSSGSGGMAGGGGTGGSAGAEPGASDDIFGQDVPRSNAFWTDDGRIYYGDEEVQLRGMSWFGLDTETLALFGPSDVDRSVRDFLMQVREWGFNALRIPLSPQSIQPGHATASWAVRGELDTGREHLDELVDVAAELGFYMLLDVHTCDVAAGYMAGGPEDAACNGYSEDAWLRDLRTLADIADAYAPQVVGIDLFNEPHSLSWSEWRGYAERGGRAVLERNPRILVFVEGIGGEGYTGENGPFWGENLTGVQQAPVQLPSSRLVYSPHVYGPSVYAQPYFSVGEFPENMPEIWDQHFGFLFDGDAPVVMGEFGGRYEGDDRAWQDAFVDYLRDRGATSFFYWCLNPNSADTGGLLQSDWRTPEQDKLDLLQRLW